MRAVARTPELVKNGAQRPLQDRIMQKTSLFRATLFFAAILANVNYLAFILNPAHAGNVGFWLATALADTITIVIFASTWATALFFEVSRSRYARELAELRATGAHLLGQPVAVLITVVNEDLAIVRDTVKSALSLIGEKTVYLLDDGKRAATQKLAALLGVRYVRRSDQDGYKAGNLNNALAHHVREPFAIIVDADFALDPQFIERTIPLFADPRVAAVQTPQVYGNADTLFARGCKHLQDIFYDYLQPGKHLLRSSFCVGTNVIFRTKALREVGGLSEMHSEDIFTTLALLERGYRVSFLNERLAVGLSPRTLTSFYTQQNRWALGGFLMMLKHNTLFNRKLTPAQRIQFFLSNFFYLSGISVAIYLLSPLIAIFLNIKALNEAYLSQWLAAYALFFAGNFVLATALLKKHRLSSWVLSVFTFVPYLSALGSTLVSVRPFRWRVTNARSTSVITKLLAPYIALVCLALAVGCFLVVGVLAVHRTLGLYYAWLVVDVLVVVPFMVQGYAATSKTAPTEVTGPLAEENLLTARDEPRDVRDDGVRRSIGLPHAP
ncbi:MAG TPA: cellulose synthase catalytic subunit [Polyangiaceae bacterium]|nr:cellulose synthase catalytic subunit [Polyangiaceae bacterium]